MIRKLLLTSILGIFLAAPSLAAEKITLGSLLRQMTDLSLLAEYPDPPYVARQFSSYDRRSETPAKQGADEWYANDDHGFMLYDGVLKEATPYHAGKPDPDKPTGVFKAGSKVGIAPNRKPYADYVWVYSTAPDGGAIEAKIPQGYVKKSAITMDPQGHVMAEMDGPGCITRIWSANPDGAGWIRIYLDDAEKPVIEAPMKDLLGGKWKIKKPGEPGASATGDWIPFPDPIACERSRGFNLYFPIAYQRHCKVTVEKQDIYYHVDYRTYPKGTEIETLNFTNAPICDQIRSLDLSAGIVKANREGFPLKRGRKVDGRKADRNREFKKLHSESTLLSAGKKYTFLSTADPGLISQLEFRVGTAEKGLLEKVSQEALRGLALTIRFDAAEKPQVCCPFGEFFGTGPGLNPYESIPFEVGKDRRFTSSWPMPFAQMAEIEVENRSKENVFVALEAWLYEHKWSPRSMHFHAKWRTETMKTRPFRDWTYCDIKGKGVFVGDMLSIFNPKTAWWGEGDEKIYVDSEKFPSWFGTGSEDYYGYAWSDPKPFQHPYHNQTRCDGPVTKGHTSVNRFHILDAIPFEKSFKFDMEVWHWVPDIEVTYAATSYWYARPGATDDFKELDAKTLQHIPKLPPPFKIAGAIEGEKMKILGQSEKFDIGTQAMEEFEGKWSGDEQLWIRPPKKNSWVDLELPVEADGAYEVTAYLTKARDYGIVRFSVNGNPIGKEIDCFEVNKVLATGPISLGEVNLKKGGARLRLEVVGTHANSVGLRYMAGLDCIVLKKK